MTLLRKKPPPYQPLPYVLAAGIAGIVTDKIAALPVYFWFAAVAVCALCWLYAVCTSSKTSEMLFLLSVFSVFGLRHHQYFYQYAADDIGNYTASNALPDGNNPAAVSGTVKQMPQYYPKPEKQPGQIFESSDRTNFILAAEQLRDKLTWIPVSGNIQVSINGDYRSLHIGDTVKVFGNLSLPKPPANPGDFNRQEHLRGLRIKAVLYAAGVEKTSSLSKTSIARYLEYLRRTGIAHLEARLSPQTLPVAAGMIFGTREAVDEDVNIALLQTGTMHVLSISGMHVALVAMLTGFFLQFCGCSRRCVAFVVTAAVLLYLALTDAEAPAVRATVLILVVSFAHYYGRYPLPVNVLSTTAVVVLMLNPTELFHFGAQLSFIAVACFQWIPHRTGTRPAATLDFFNSMVKPLHRWTKRKQKEKNTIQLQEKLTLNQPNSVRYAVSSTVNRLSALFIISFIIWLISTPLILSRMHLFTPVALLVNPLLWIPLTPAMFFGFATALFGQIPFAGSIVGLCADWSFWVLLELIKFFQYLGGHYYLPGPPPWWNLVFYTGFCVITFLPVKRPPLQYLFGAALTWIGIGFGVGYYADHQRLYEYRLTMSVLSVGHGQCVMLQTPENKIIVCDTGCLNSPAKAAGILSNAVWRAGKTHIDAVVLSHPDVDHINGVALVLEKLSVGAVYITPYFDNPRALNVDREMWNDLKRRLNEKHIPIHTLKSESGGTAVIAGLPIEVLHPPAGLLSADTNDSSLVLRFKHHGTSVMLTGDLDGAELVPFLRTSPEHTDIVLVPHHGGHSRQTEPLLSWATPQTLIISGGSWLYRKDKLDAWRQRGFIVRHTLEEGAVILELK